VRSCDIDSKGMKGMIVLRLSYDLCYQNNKGMMGGINLL
jgi:hypothetical protein